MALGPTQQLTEMSVKVKDGRCVRLTTLPLSLSRLSRENVGASTSHNTVGLHGLLENKLNSETKSSSELYRPSDRRLSAKLVPTLADGGCRVVSATNPHSS
jgi:hypothetical protein